ncbi:hypothetical protein ACNPM8_01640 [Glutamicibacter sp. AGC46]
MSNSHIDRAIWLAGKIANAEATGQPNLAALYERNMLQVMQKARKDIAAERIGVVLAEIIDFLGQKVKAGFAVVAKFLAGVEQAVPGTLEELKIDYALVGPGEGH